MDLNRLKELAIEAAGRAYAPYSKFSVGCAILTKSGTVYTGCNVENASYGLTICAERNAISNAIAKEGSVEIEKVIVFTPTDSPATPCGACRQTIHEFAGEDTEIHSFCSSDETLTTTIGTLLPNAFDLKKHRH